MRVALDVEGVLADTMRHFLRVYNYENGTNHSLDDVTYWGWAEDAVDFDEFMAVTERAWEERAHFINPMEMSLDESVSRLAGLDSVSTLDIVTAAPASETAITSWLSHYGITSYDSFVAVDHTETKAALGYDAYIDDKPLLADQLDDEQVQYLRMQPYTQSHHDHPRTVTVPTVAKAVDAIAESTTISERSVTARSDGGEHL